MPTRTQPVPWSDVADLVDALAEWLVKERKLDAGVTRRQLPMQLAKESLRGAERGSLPMRVAAWIVVLERYQAAGFRQDPPARLSPTEKDLLYNDKLERDADAAIRGLTERVAHIRRLVGKIGARQEQRLELLFHGKDPERMEPAQAANRSAFDALNDDLAVFDDAIEGLRASFHQFNQARTAAPLTLSGWQGLRKKIKESLAGAGYPWPKEAARRSSGVRASSTAPSKRHSRGKG